jgi:hydrogenase expression/formation protein HypC
MCLAVPMLIDTVTNDGMASVSMVGVTHTVNVSLVDNPTPGEYVIIHAGFAIEKLNVEEAEARLELFGELAEIKRKAEGK